MSAGMDVKNEPPDSQGEQSLPPGLAAPVPAAPTQPTSSSDPAGVAAAVVAPPTPLLTDPLPP
eukprot:6367091-Prorocentrum_lima.AAC.1